MTQKEMNKFFKPKVKHYALAIESSAYVKEGELQAIPNKMIDEVLKTGKFKFSYPFNMHWDTDELKCLVIKETTTHKVILTKSDAEQEDKDMLRKVKIAITNSRQYDDDENREMVEWVKSLVELKHDS